MSPGRHRTIAFVGGGPRTVGLLERLSANAAELLGPDPLHIHVIDPHPAGGGRIWRTAQSELLWMNSMARDVTIFTDDSVTCEGPIVTGPALDEWVKDQGKDILDGGRTRRAGCDALGPDDFASRQLQSHYLKWAHDRAVRSLPPQVQVTEHRTEALVLAETESGQRILLADGGSVTADVVVLAQGFLDREPTSEEAALSSAAKQHGLTYIPPGYTADVDLSDLRAGEPVLVRGFGLAFIDLMVLLAEGRGGRFSSEPASRQTHLSVPPKPHLSPQRPGTRVVRRLPSRGSLPLQIGLCATRACPDPATLFHPGTRWQRWPVVGASPTSGRRSGR